MLGHWDGVLARERRRPDDWTAGVSISVVQNDKKVWNRREYYVFSISFRFFSFSKSCIRMYVRTFISSMCCRQFFVISSSFVAMEIGVKCIDHAITFLNFCVSK